MVLLDFGLTADLESSGRHRTTDRQIVGTVAHMSPEQAAGLLDHGGERLVQRRRHALRGPDRPAAVRRAAPGADPRQADHGAPLAVGRWSTGCRTTWFGSASSCSTAIRPRRPTGREIIARLTGLAPGSADAPEPSRPLPLIGRARHLQVLDSVFASLVGGRTQSIFVFGRTGTGKTTLIRSFLEGLSSQEEAVVLWGRCYERESVPVQGPRQPDRRPGPVPQGAVRRGRSRPSCRRTWRTWPGCSRSCRGCRRSPRPAATRPSCPIQQELRRRAFAALRELLQAAGAEGPRWSWRSTTSSGATSIARILLSDLLCSPQSPVLLFLGSFRSEDAEDCPFLARAATVDRRAAPAGLEHRELAVEALTQSEARELTLALLGRDDPVAGRRRTWSRASRGATRCSSTSWSSTSRAAARSTTGRRSASSTSTRCSGSGSAASRRKRSGCWAPSPSPGGRSARRWPSRPPSWTPAAGWRWPRSARRA